MGREARVVKILALAVQESREAEMSFEVGEASGLDFWGKACHRLPDQCIDPVDERQSSENCGSLAVDVVGTGGAATQLGIVHGGQIVEEKGCGVEVLDGDGQVF